MASRSLASEAVLIVDDEEDFVELTAAALDRHGYEAFKATSIDAAAATLKAHFVDVILLDERIGRDSGVRFLGELRNQHPGLSGIVISADANLALAQRAMRAGAADVLAKPVSAEELLSSIRAVLDGTALAREARRNQWIAEHTSRPPAIVGNSQAIRQVLETVSLVAAATTTVLIHGESGTGKELIASAIHAASPRRGRLMTSINMAAISPEMIEAELFGAARGSYTGSIKDRVGFFEAAHGSTLFLDEIGDAPASLQVKLLRVLEERSITRVGETRARPVDVRLIAASNRNLRREVQAGRFREDLLFRLNVVRIDVPALRDRAEDVEPIANHLLARFAREHGRPIRGFDPDALRLLRNYDWPGNVRELRNVIERAVVLAKGTRLAPADLALQSVAPESAEWAALLEQDVEAATTEFLRRYYVRLLKRADNNRTKAAELAGVNRSTIHLNLKRLGLGDD